VDLRNFLTVLKRWAWLIVAGAVLAGGSAYLVSTLLTSAPAYEARAVVLVGPALTTNDANPNQIEAARRVSLVYVEVAGSRPLLERVADELELDLPADVLRSLVTVTTPQEPPIITVSAVADDPRLAAALANGVVAQLIAVAPGVGGGGEQAQQFIERQVEGLELEIETLIPQVETLANRPTRTAAQDERLAELQTRLASLRATYATLVTASSPASSSELTVIEEAVPSPAPLPRGRAQTVLFAGLLGLVLALSVAFLVEHLDDKIRAPEDAERITRLPNLGDIGTLGATGRHADLSAAHVLPPGSSGGEGFRSLRTNIELSAASAPRSLLISSPLRGEGRTTVSANLAVAFAQAGRRVLLVDADLRQPGLDRLFNLPNTLGLSDALRSGDSPADLAQPTAITGLRVLTSGERPHNPSELATSSRMRDVIADLVRTNELVIFDSPPVLEAAEPAMLASVLDATLLVLAAGRTTQASLRETRDTLALARATVIGTVLNRVSGSRSRRRADHPARGTDDVHGYTLRNDQPGS
jgi:non-specific protein-tyrosine kinase